MFVSASNNSNSIGLTLSVARIITEQDDIWRLIEYGLMGRFRQSFIKAVYHPDDGGTSGFTLLKVRQEPLFP